MEPQRNVPGDGEPRWFEGGEWDRGRHGAPASGGSYRGAEEEYTGAFAEPASAPPAPDPVETSRRSTEAIDGAAPRRPPVSSSPAGYPPPPAAYPPSAAYAPSEPPLYPATPSEGGGPGASPAGGFGGGAAQPSGFGGGPAPAQPGAGQPGAGQVGAPGAFGAPTAAVHTIAPSHHQRSGPGPSIYQSRKPVVLIALAALTVLFEIPALRLLVSATVADGVPASGVVAGTFLVLGIPVFAYGVHGLLGGPVPANPAAWLKQPLIYLPLGVLLFLFAALAT